MKTMVARPQDEEEERKRARKAQQSGAAVPREIAREEPSGQQGGHRPKRMTKGQMATTSWGPLVPLELLHSSSISIDNSLTHTFTS
jgi:hypothetical protein